ncbi:MAG: DUF1573 domain-containing protein [Staphylococcus sp.]|nr:DUF1573 domain-containing protein [Staphylococcus sp.]
MNMIKFLLSILLLLFSSGKVFSQTNSANVSVLWGIPAREVKEIDLGTLPVGEDIWCGCALYNKGNTTLEITDVKFSHPDMKGGVSTDILRPEYKIGLRGIVKFKSAVGDFRITMKVYYKNVKQPTEVTFKGKIVDK